MTNIDQLAAEINRRLTLYANRVTEGVEKAAEEVAEESAEQLKSSSPKRTGDYAKKWAVKKVGKNFVIHNKKYQLTHLLEKGHAKVGGGRVAAKVHIKPVEQKAIRDLEQKVRAVARQ